MTQQNKPARRFSFRRYPAPAYIITALDSLRPPEDITVSQWAEKYRLLDEKSSAMPGHWKNEVTPYLSEIMDAFSDWETEKIVFVKPTQVGGTEALNNMLGYAAAQDPAPAMIVEPTVEMAESFSINRLTPMFRKSPALRKRFKARASQKTELQCDSMYITLEGSNSPAGLASKPIRYLFLDEVDKYPPASKKEADPVSLAIERTKTFGNRKIYMCSTPTTKDGRIWREKEGCDIEKHFFIPCPHCGAWIELKFSGLTFPKVEGLSDADRAELAAYACQECGGVINDADKIRALRRGRWQTVKESPKAARSVAFWMNTLYSPFTRFADVARAFLQSKDDPEMLHNFRNSWLAEPWEETREKSTAETVIACQTDLEEFTVPEWAKMLTGGVDVQESSLYFVIRAWGDFMTSQLITRRQVLSFQDIETAMNADYFKPDGTAMVVDLCLIDSGDQTDEVYAFAADRSSWCLPCKGTSTMLSHYKLSTVNKTGSRAAGLTLVLVDGGKYKDAIASRMAKKKGRGAWMVFSGIDEEYCEQVTAEHKVMEKTSAGTRYRWTPKTSHADNHFLDAEVYAMAAADLLGVRALYLQNEEAPAAAPDAPQVQKETETNSAGGSGGGWLSGSGGGWL